MARPISIIDSGGKPVTNIADLDANQGIPMTPVDAPLYGEPVTLVDTEGGSPVTLINEDGTLWSAGPVGPSPAFHQNFLLDSGSAMSVAAVVGPTLTFTRAGSGTCFNESGVLVTETTNTPRFDHDPGAGNAARGLLFEGNSTNSCLWSEDFTNAAWNKINVDVPTTNNASPDGANTADEIAATTTADQQYAVYQSFTGLTAGRATTVSAFLKAGVNATLVQLVWDADGAGTNGCFCNFNLSSGAKGTPTALTSGTANSAFIQDLGGGLYKLSLSGSIASGTVGRFTIGIVDSISEGVFGSANLTDNDSIIAWGAQVEHVNLGLTTGLASSYIATTSAAVSRITDVCTTSDVTWHSGAAGSWVLKFRANGYGATTRYPFGINDGSNSDFELFEMNTSGGIRTWIKPTTGNQGTTTNSTLVIGDLHKIAFAYQTDDLAKYFDGSAAGTDATVDYPTGLSSLALGEFLGGNKFFGHIEDLKYYDSRVTNDFMVTATT